MWLNAFILLIYFPYQELSWNYLYKGDFKETSKDLTVVRLIHYCHLLLSMMIFEVYQMYTDFPAFSLKELLYLPALFFYTQGWFYFAHRLMHHPKLYLWHKEHHYFKEPPPFGTFYCSTFEHLFVNMGSLMIPLCLFSFSQITVYLWAFTVLHNSVSAHMGTQYQGSEHWIHHQKFTVNFGSGTLFDKWFGTHESL